MRKKLVSTVLILALVLSFTACGTQNSYTETTSTRTFTDDCGRRVVIPHEISRAAPAGALAQMYLCAIAPEIMTGLASKWNSAAAEYIPDETETLPYFGQLYNSADMNIEELAAAEPQLIIDIGEKKDSVGENMDILSAQTNIPAVFIAADLESSPQTFRTLGALLGKEEKGESLALFCEKVYSRTADIMAKAEGSKARALYVLGEEGLNVIARGSYHSQVLDLLTDNLAVVDNPGSKGLGNEVSMEQIALWNPDFVLFSTGSIYDTVTEKDAWSEINAIANGTYAEVPFDLYNWMGNPPGVQRYLALIWLPALLYPEYCDYNVKEEITEYFRLFYGVELSDSQYAALTANAFWE